MDSPKSGERVPVEMFHVSKCNVRYNEPFGITKEDQEFKEHLKFNPIRVPMEARPEGDEFGVYIGRRRFLAKKDYTTHFVVGKDLLIFDVSKEEARESSFIENNEYLKKNMDSITYAENLNLIASHSGGKIRATAQRLGISASGLSEYLTMLQGLPSQKMRDVIRKYEIPFKGKGSSDPHSALGLAKMKLDKEKLDELTEVAENGGVQALWQRIDFMVTGKQKRGLPKDAYDVDRVTWKKSNKFERKYSDNICKAAKNKKLTKTEYIKMFLINHMKEIEKDAKIS